MHIPQFLIDIIPGFPYLGIFIYLVLTNLTPFPEELSLLLIGYAVATKATDFYLTALIAILGLLASDNIIYWLSRSGSKYIEKLAHKLGGDEIEEYERDIKKNIGKVVFILRFISSFRILGQFLAGSLKVKWLKFQFYDLLAILIYVPTLIFLGYRSHQKITSLIVQMETIRGYLFWFCLIAIGIIAHFYFKHHPHHRKKEESNYPQSG